MKLYLAIGHLPQSMFIVGIFSTREKAIQANNELLNINTQLNCASMEVELDDVLVKADKGN